LFIFIDPLNEYPKSFVLFSYAYLARLIRKYAMPKTIPICPESMTIVLNSNVVSIA
jgi:hypothetical protein